MLREMAIRFPSGKLAYTLCTHDTEFGTDKSEMLKIPGIDPDKVERYGERFLKLIRTSPEGYESLMQQQGDRPW